MGVEGLTYGAREPIADWINNPTSVQVLFEMNSDAVFVFDVTGRLVTANPVADAWIGPHASDLQTFVLTHLFVPELSQQTQALFQRALAGESLCEELTIQLPDNQRVEAQVKWVPIRSGEQTLGLYLIAKDITHKQATEQVSQENIQINKLIEENVQDIIASLSPDGVCRYISPVCRTVLGYEPEELVGKQSIDFYHPDDAAEVLARYQGDRGEMDYNVFTYRVRHKDGHYVWIETMAKMIRNQNGELEKIVGVSRDITQRQVMLEELRSTKDQLESFIENAVDAIVIFDVHGMLLRVNPAYEKLFGFTEQEVVGLYAGDHQIIPPHLQAQVTQHVERVIRGESILGLESTCLTKSGEEVNVLLSITPIRSGKQEIIGWSVTFRDLTERKRTQALLLQSEKLSIAGQLAAGVAHEIRNPLTSLKGFVQLMKISGKENELYLDVMSSELNRIELIVSELLVLAKPQATTFRTKDVTRLLQEVVTLIDTQAIMSNIQVVTDFADDLPLILCDENQLKQVFINFLKNAIEAMQEGGQIRIEAHRGNEMQVLLRFVDEGCGISDDLIARIGEPFYTTKEKGTGLGMMVSKKIIESHGGQMKIHSQMGVGTTIEMNLPGVAKWEEQSEA